MAQDYASSIAGSAIRVSRLRADGTIATGATASYKLESFISVSFTPEYEEGDEITQKDANGAVCVSFKQPDTLKRVSIEIAICNPDPEFTEITSGGLLLEDSGTTDSVGWAAPEVGVDANPNGVAVEVWSKAVQAGKIAAANPYWHWVFPYVKVRPSGTRVIENGLLANTFEGFGVGNVGFGDGPDGSWLFPSATNRPYAYARTTATPSGNGYVSVA